jgi:hypothetical protein
MLLAHTLSPSLQSTVILFLSDAFQYSLPHPPRFSKWCLVFIFPHQNSVCISHLALTCNTPHLTSVLILSPYNTGRLSQWPRCLTRGSAAAHLLGLRVPIPPRARECRNFSSRGLCVGLITRTEESF